MKIPRGRFTINTIMVATAGLAIAFGLLARTATLLRIADDHVRRMAVSFSAGPSEGDNSRWVPILSDSQGNLISERRHFYHGEMAGKYRKAATRPWSPVTHYPPEPE
jgi:hypothetical protein